MFNGCAHLFSYFSSCFCNIFFLFIGIRVPHQHAFHGYGTNCGESQSHGGTCPGVERRRVCPGSLRTWVPQLCALSLDLCGFSAQIEIEKTLFRETIDKSLLGLGSE